MRGWVFLQVSLVLLSGFSSPVSGKISEITVDISGNTVDINCPTDAITIKKETAEKGEMHTCGQKRIYLKVKVCEDCVELGLGLVAGVVISDLLITLGVLCMVYFCCKNRAATFRGEAKGGGSQGQPRGPKVDCPPPVPNPDYEPIRKGQREVYAGLGPRPF